MDNILDMLFGHEMSPEYHAAMLVATRNMQELGPKITSHTPLTPEEGERLLNGHSAVYRFALAEKDPGTAQETQAFIRLVKMYLEKIQGYTVEFIPDDKCYTVRVK